MYSSNRMKLQVNTILKKLDAHLTMCVRHIYSVETLENHYPDKFHDGFILSNLMHGSHIKLQPAILQKVNITFFGCFYTTTVLQSVITY